MCVIDLKCVCVCEKKEISLSNFVPKKEIYLSSYSDFSFPSCSLSNSNPYRSFFELSFFSFLVEKA